MVKSPKLFVVSGPTAAGKGTLLKLLREKRPDLAFPVSATTRSPRAGEIDGVHYHFISDERFTELVDEDAFLEWAHVHDHRYGTLKSEIEDRIASGNSVILEIDIQGALNVKRVYPDAVLIFIVAPSIEVMEQRLCARGTEDEDQIRIRLATARVELGYADSYDVVIVNDIRETAAQELADTISSYENMNGGSE